LRLGQYAWVFFWLTVHNNNSALFVLFELL